MRSALALLASWMLAAGVLQANPADVRFSVTLNAEEKSASGLSRLSSDEVAVVDALVRRDTTSRAGTTEAAATSFTQRLTPGERETAGVVKLSETERPKLDTFVARYQSAKLARALLAPPAYLARGSRLIPTEDKKEREIHGSFSLSYGFGSGGYSEKTGSMVLTMEDPAKGYSISIGYSESHVKGGSYYRDPYYYGRDPFYSPLRPLPDEPFPDRP